MNKERDELFDAIKSVAHRLESGDTSGGLPLCGKCGQTHDPRYTECPPKYCLCCGITHKPNEPFHYNNCESNERFKKWSNGHQEWVKKN